MPIEARRIPADHPDALALVQAMVDGLTEIYGPADPARPTPTATPEDFTPPGGTFVCLYDGHLAVAGGGVKRLYADTGEIKRMFVLPDRRGQGLARRLLAEIEAAARDLGYAKVRLDTGAEQPHAEALYRSAGYAEIPDYNDNSYAKYWGEKAL